MTPDDLPQFAVTIRALLEPYERQPTDVALRVWYETLAPWPLDEIRRGCTRFLRDPANGHAVPRPPAIVAYLDRPPPRLAPVDPAHDVAQHVLADQRLRLIPQERASELLARLRGGVPPERVMRDLLRSRAACLPPAKSLDAMIEDAADRTRLR